MFSFNSRSILHGFLLLHLWPWPFNAFHWSSIPKSLVHYVVLLILLLCLLCSYLSCWNTIQIISYTLKCLLFKFDECFERRIVISEFVQVNIAALVNSIDNFKLQWLFRLIALFILVCKLHNPFLSIYMIELPLWLGLLLILNVSLLQEFRSLYRYHDYVIINKYLNKIYHSYILRVISH
jgi:hypothetical protein